MLDVCTVGRSVSRVLRVRHEDADFWHHTIFSRFRHIDVDASVSGGLPPEPARIRFLCLEHACSHGPINKLISTQLPIAVPWTVNRLGKPRPSGIHAVMITKSRRMSVRSFWLLGATPSFFVMRRPTGYRQLKHLRILTLLVLSRAVSQYTIF